MILGIVGTIRFYPQQASSKICLTDKQFDYYAQAIVERNFLSRDTSLLSARIRVYQKIVFQKTQQLSEDSIMLLTKDKIISENLVYTKSLLKTIKKADKKLTFWKSLSGFAGIGILVSLILFSIK